MATNNACNQSSLGLQTLLSTGAFAGRTLTAPAAGFTISNSNGTAGNPTFALSDDLAALEGLATTGVAIRTGTSTWSATAGSTGQLMVAGSPPAFAASANGGFTFTSSTASVNREVIVRHTDNTSATSGAQVSIVTQPGGGDCYSYYAIAGVRSYAWGIDNSDSDKFKLVSSAAIASPSTAASIMEFSTAGARTLPLNPTVFAYVHNGGANLTNVTGDGTTYTIPYDAVAVDLGSNFNTGTGTFTAPVTGRYRVTVNATMTNLGAGHTSALLAINANGAISRSRFNPVASAVSGSYTATLSGIYQVTASGTITSLVTVSGSTKTVGLEFDNFGYYTSMEINLIG